MSWRALTEDDLRTQLSVKELDAFRNFSNQGDDPIASVLKQVTDQVRGYILGNPNNVLGPDDTVPEKLVGQAVALAVMVVMSRAGGRIVDLNGQRKSASEAAVQLLKDVSRGFFKIDTPTTRTTETTSYTAPSIASGFTHFSRWQQDGY